MTSSTMDLLDRRLDALDRALMGLVPRSERIELVAGVEKRFREKQETEPALLETLATSQAGETTESLAAPAGAAHETAGGKRRRSRLALTSGILGIVAVSLMLMLPITYVVIATMAEMMGEVPAIALIMLNVFSVAGTGALAGFLSLAAIVSISRSKKKKRGMGWAITGLCTSPLPVLVGLLAIVFFVLPITMDYVAQSDSSSSPPYVASVPSSVPVSQPMMLPPVECQNGVCPLPPPLDPTAYASALAMSPPVPVKLDSVPLTPVSSTEEMTKALPVSELKVETEKKAEPVIESKPTPEVKPMLETKPTAAGGEEAEATKPATALAPLSGADMEESLP